ncbi:MAG: SGNH/GDSL hydrolase family protein [Deltaproteobacteria bacterium]|nr:SGNH/GDSL hydrolase family protein [Candidatus Anaeroferrophillus wilburensis]MBN2888058.1 SGNH/GDSL hydrolase family protein [Deltaproteobacteria bacterium]
MNNHTARKMFSLACLGDSITHGFGVRHAWCQIARQQLQKQFPALDLRLINAGVDGDTLLGGRKRLRRDVLRYRPQLVTVAFGLNDLYLGAPPAEFRHNLLAVVEALLAIESLPVLLTTIQPAAPAMFLGGGSPETYNAIIRQTADRQGVLLLDIWRSWPVLEDPMGYFLVDGVHPNETGHAFMGMLAADVLAPVIQKFTGGAAE